ncbi:hypothetical protein D7231_31750 [Streptomyces klenkii]|uniref:DNA-damage-inducible protein D n=1 Tax=Streptomyces klenkii TaxID=1420899 RepID=A0A3B0AMD3_9ACTN|nr:RhuM family protein [Streptomyces klenkii]RKN61849.1 hypothetical protein D7231_31750 [Streptomyces klenkii]
MDAYGREHWNGREMQPLMEYSQWRDYAAVIRKARASLALVEGESAAQKHFAETRNLVRIGSGARREAQDFRLTRFGAYLTAMAGDDTKSAVAHARVYFAVRTREAELGALEAEEVRQTALARSREMVDYRVFRDMMAENAPDYSPSSPATRMFFAMVQNELYRHLTGMDAQEIRSAREINTWPGRLEGKLPRTADRKVAKNYLTAAELAKLDRLVARLCLRAMDIADDDVHLSLAKWDGLVRTELMMSRRALAA